MLYYRTLIFHPKSIPCISLRSPDLGQNLMKNLSGPICQACGVWGRGASHIRLGAQPLLGSLLEEVAVRAQGLIFMSALLAQSAPFRGPAMAALDWGNFLNSLSQYFSIPGPFPLSFLITHGSINSQDPLFLRLNSKTISLPKSALIHLTLAQCHPVGENGTLGSWHHFLPLVCSVTVSE